MKYLHLVWAALLRRKGRTTFTLLSIMTAFVLFGLLDAVRSTFQNAGAGLPSAYRLLTYSKLNFGAPLSSSLFLRIQNVPGVLNASYGSNFSGYYQDPKNRVSIETYEANFLSPELYPEWRISPEHRQAFAATRTGVLVGETLAKKYGWRVGDKIPLRSTVLRQDGSPVWTFDLVGIFHIDNPNLKMLEGLMCAHWKYFDEERVADKGTVQYFAFKVADPSNADYVAREIDELFTNSANETHTQSEQAFVASFTKQLANVGLIVYAVVGSVFFTLVLLTGNIMSQAMRERIPEMAILKTVGFSNKHVMMLLLSESVLMLMLGSVLGLTLATLGVGYAAKIIGLGLPVLPVGLDVWLRGLALAALIGLSVGALPARRGMKLRIVDALSGC